MIVQRNVHADSTAGGSSGNAHAIAGNTGCGSLIGESKAMQRLYRLIREYAPGNANLFLVGENGSGKELVARTIHEMSPRSMRDFVTLNCSALSPEKLEGELFGHGKDVSSGASRGRRGYLPRASGATLFLDEITEMNAGLQARLLQALEFTEAGPRDGERNFMVDARLVAATSLDPGDAVQHGRLREDLYIKLAPLSIRVPSLRERGRDTVTLAEHFLRERNAETATVKQFDDEVRHVIRKYDWPGNVQELKSTVRHSHLLSGDIIKLEDLPGNVSQAGPGNGDFIRVSIGTPLAQVERRAILATLEHFDGDKKKAAEILRISLKTLYNRLKQYNDKQ